MRFPIACLPLAFTGACAPSTSTNIASVDIKAAAAQAQNTVDAYDANIGTRHNAAAQAPESEAANDSAASNAAGDDALDRTPVSEASFAPDSPQGAANVLQTYYALIRQGKYARAFALRDAGAAEPESAADLAASLARYSEYRANVGAPGRIDAGAGQRYVTVPVQVHARLRAGSLVDENGSATLHRIGDVDGATAAQRTWHIRSIDLKPAPKP